MVEEGLPNKPLLLKSVKRLAKRKKKKKSRSVFFRTLKINQRFTVTWGAIIQEKWPNPDDKSKLCGDLMFPSPPQPSAAPIL